MNIPLDLSAVERSLDSAAMGARLDVVDAENLLNARGDAFDRLLRIAGDARDAGLSACGRPGVITYSRKVFIPLTTLCRDRCHYCIFVDTPLQLLKMHKPTYMSAEQVLAVARQGAAMGCKEALLTLGDRPEERWPEARAWLEEHGFTSTLDYVGAMARLITAETGLLAHLNPGVMSFDELQTLRPTAPSMGMMLETTSRRLYEEPGEVHFGSPDKDPDLRLAVIDDAGRARIPFTTGILVGIGETLHDRAQSLLALREIQERHGGIQEVIVQNFRAKPRTAMQGAPDASVLEYVAAVAVARLVMGPNMRIQVPPNLSDPAEFDLLVRAGADDWGGVSPLTADHVNPERPWPHLDDLAAMTSALGYQLRERLTAQPEFVLDASTWIDSALNEAVARLADSESGLASSGTVPTARGMASSQRTSHGPGLKRLAEAAASDPMSLDDDEWVGLLEATGSDLVTVTATADDVRRYTVGEAISLVVNRNLASSGLRASPRAPGEFDLSEAAAIATDAWDLGATEICVQGRMPESEDPIGYLQLARAIKTAVPSIHLHAYRPQDVWDLANRSGLGLAASLAALRDAGVDTVTGTGVKVLSERVRTRLASGDLEIDRWVEAIMAAHNAGFRSTAVLFYGHVETAGERVAHLLRLRQLQTAAIASGAGGGFTEFVPIPLPGHGVPLVESRSPFDEHRSMVAISRLMLSGSIPNIQVPWTRVDRATATELLRVGGNDLGGALLDGRVRPDAGAEQGLELPIKEAAAIAAHLFRPFRQRTTDYKEPATVGGRA